MPKNASMHKNAVEKRSHKSSRATLATFVWFFLSCLSNQRPHNFGNFELKYSGKAYCLQGCQPRRGHQSHAATPSLVWLIYSFIFRSTDYSKSVRAAWLSGFSFFERSSADAYARIHWASELATLAQVGQKMDFSQSIPTISSTTISLAHHRSSP